MARLHRLRADQLIPGFLWTPFVEQQPGERGARPRRGEVLLAAASISAEVSPAGVCKGLRAARVEVVHMNRALFLCLSLSLAWTILAACGADQPPPVAPPSAGADLPAVPPVEGPVDASATGIVGASE